MPHKLLLADDSVTIQRVIELTFADEDVQVIAVGNGADAIDRAQRDLPDIVLADVGMPERDGYEVAQFIKNTPALAHIPVVLLTGAFEPVDENRARAVGCDGVLVKPFEPQIVISRVKDLLAGKRPSGMWGGGPVAQGPVRQAPAADADPKGAAPPAQQGDSLEAYFDHLDAAFGGTGEAALPMRPASDPIPLSRRLEPAPAAPAPTPVPMPPAPSESDPFADWDPDLMGDPTRLAAADPPPFQPPPFAVPPPFSAAPPPLAAEPPVAAAPDVTPPLAPPPVVVPVVAPVPEAPAAATPMQIPSLVDAFAALLSAEQKVGVTPSAATGPAQDAAPGNAALTDDVIESIADKVLARLSDQSRPAILDVAERLVREEIERIKSIG